MSDKKSNPLSLPSLSSTPSNADSGYIKIYGKNDGKAYVINSSGVEYDLTSEGVTSVGLTTGTSGTDINVSGSPITTTGSFTLNIPTASASNRGVLSSTDWTTFNNKVGGSGTANQFAYFSGTSTLTSSPVFSFNTHGVTLQKGTWNAFINGGNNTLSGTGNVGIGSNQTLSSVTSGTNNVALGNAAGFQNSTGSNNFYLGYLSGYSNQTSSDNVFVGGQAGYTVTGASNCYIGGAAGYNAGASTATTSIGTFSGYAGGSSNVDIGFYAGFNATGSFNTRIGRQAGQNASTSTNNIYIGYAAGQNNTGSNNTIIGNSAGQTGDGSSNVFLGYNAANTETGSNLLYIENSSSTTPLIGGNFSTDRVGINTPIASIARTLHVTGDVRITDLTTDTPTNIVGSDADGDLGTVTIGTGLSLSGGTLSNTGVIGSGTATRVAFWDGTSSLSSNSNLYWDNTNSRLGIGTTAPVVTFEVAGTEARIQQILRLGNHSSAPVLFPFSGSSYSSINSAGRGMSFWSNANTAGDYGVVFTGDSVSQNSGNYFNAAFVRLYQPTGGTGVFNAMYLAPTINQLSGATGITRSIYINPTLTSATDYRSIDIANQNSGWAFYSNGTAKSYFGGDLTVNGLTKPAYKPGTTVGLAGYDSSGYFSDVTLGSRLTIAAGTLNVSNEVPWNVITANTTATVNNAYITNSGGLLRVTLPTTAAVGSIIKIVGKGAGGWRILQPAGVSVYESSVVFTTVGVGGTISSSDIYDSIEIICTVADTEWVVVNKKGTLSYA